MSSFTDKMDAAYGVQNPYMDRIRDQALQIAELTRELSVWRMRWQCMVRSSSKDVRMAVWNTEGENPLHSMQCETDASSGGWIT